MSLDPTCCVGSPFSDPNNARFKTYGHLQNYSRFECDPRVFNADRFFVMGTRNPPCDIAKPYMQVCGSDTIEYMEPCDKFANYARNGRFYGSIYGEK